MHVVPRLFDGNRPANIHQTVIRPTRLFSFQGLPQLKNCPKFLSFNGVGDLRWETILETAFSNRRVNGIDKRAIGTQSETNLFSGRITRHETTAIGYSECVTGDSRYTQSSNLSRPEQRLFGFERRGEHHAGRLCGHFNGLAASITKSASK